MVLYITINGKNVLFKKIEIASFQLNFNLEL